MAEEAVKQTIIFVAFKVTIDDMSEELLQEAETEGIDWRMLYTIKQVQAEFPQLELPILDWYKRAERIFQELRVDDNQPNV